MSRTLAALASLVLTLVGVVVLYPPDYAYACTCGIPPANQTQNERTERALSNSDAVFSGEVSAIEKKEAATSRHPGTSTVTLRVSEVWKGPRRTTLEVNTQRGVGWSCGYDFEEGQEYLIYANGKGKSLGTSICHGTKSLSKADKDLTLLGNGEKPKAGGDKLTDTSGIVGARAMVGIAGLAMAASFLVAVRLVRTG